MGLLILPSLASAQVVDSKVSIDSIRDQIQALTIQLLLAQIEELKAQIADILVKQMPINQQKKVQQTQDFLETQGEGASALDLTRPHVTVASSTCSLNLPVRIIGDWKESLMKFKSGNIEISKRFTNEADPQTRLKSLEFQTSIYLKENNESQSVESGRIYQYQIETKYGAPLPNRQYPTDIMTGEVVYTCN